MSNLRVTDVQSVLRKFAGLGHDVTSDPRAINLEGRSYGVPVGHFLNMQPFHNRPGEHHGLFSYVAQAEKPVISQIYTSHADNPNKGLDRVSREVSPLTPLRLRNNEKDSGRDVFESHEPEGSKTKGWYSAESLAPSGSLLWTPNKNRRMHSDAHEALEHHRTGEFPHGEIDDIEEGMGDMVPKDRFNFKNASADLVTPAVPYKGLVTVGHGVGSSRKVYVYNPETEQMFRHGDYGA